MKKLFPNPVLQLPSYPFQKQLSFFFFFKSLRRYFIYIQEIHISCPHFYTNGYIIAVFCILLYKLNNICWWSLQINTYSFLTSKDCHRILIQMYLNESPAAQHLGYFGSFGISKKTTLNNLLSLWSNTLEG